MASKYQRLVARGRIAAIPVVAAAAITGGVVGVTSASAKKVGSTAGAAVSKTTIAKLKTYVADQQAAPAWIAPGPAVNAKKALKGKTIVTFPISSEIDACNLKGQQGYLDAEAKALGAKVIPLNTTAGPPSWISQPGHRADRQGQRGCDALRSQRRGACQPAADPEGRQDPGCRR